MARRALSVAIAGILVVACAMLLTWVIQVLRLPDFLIYATLPMSLATVYELNALVSKRYKTRG